MSDKDRFWPFSIGALVLIGAVLATLYFLKQPEEEIVEPPKITAPITATPEVPIPRTPVTAPARAALPLPPLDGSDADILGGLNELLGAEAVATFLIPERIVRNIVVTIDNATREQMALNQRPIAPTPGDFVASGPEGERMLSPENFDRYTPFVATVKRIDAKTLVALYRGLQPLFQQAYEELGHPNGVFNSRLIEVIDHLLTTPDPRGDIRLVQPSVLYRYADETLERQSAGRKLLIRMGPTHAAVIKEKLREIRSALR